MAAIFQQLGRLSLICGLAMVLGLSGAASALAWPISPAASIHTYHEQPQQTTYRSRLTLPDRHDQAWQATLFHRYSQGREQGPYLRLVAFPGSAAVSPDGNLQIESGAGLRWSAPANNATLPLSRPNNIGQYDLSQVLPALKTPIPLTLEVPLVGGQTRQLVVAPYVVEEWQALEALGD